MIIILLSHAQSLAQEKQPIKIEIEVDPLAYILKGYSLHGGVTYGKFRSSMGTFAIEQPDFFVENKAFSVYSSGFDIKTDYLFNKTTGIYTGLQLTYGRDKTVLKGSQETDEVWGLNIGLRTGYRWMLGKKENQYTGLYINPWFALLYSPDAKTITKGIQKYEQSNFSVFPAVHLGWRF